jgi:hypothetical protein
VAAGALVAFGLALLAVTGLEAVRGAPLSGGQGTTVGRVLGDAGAAEPAGPSRSPTTTQAPSSTPPTTTTTTPTTATPDPSWITTPGPTTTTNSDQPSSAEPVTTTAGPTG